MNTKRATKRALLTSVMALVMCVVMLVGTTFAWFTDTASTGVNKIQAGNLKVLLVDENGNDLEGETLKWKTADNRAQTQILWEPGCTYELQPVYVKNDGNLALKYKIVISGINGSAKLNEVIDWTINDTDLDSYHSLAVGATSDALTIKGHMQETAGNDYQDEFIDGIAITVYATQDTVENDSFGPDYDKDAPYEIVKVSDEKELRTALFNAPTDGNGVKIVLQDDITLDLLYAAPNLPDSDVIQDYETGDTLNRYKKGVHPSTDDPSHWNKLVTDQTAEEKSAYGAYYHAGANDERIARLVVKANQDVIIDLNGHTIAKDARATHGDWSNTCTDIIANYGKLKVTDSVGTGVVKGNGYVSCGGAVLHNYAGAVMTIENVNVDGNAQGFAAKSGQYVISNEGGKIVIDGANIYDSQATGDNAASLLHNVTGTMIVKGNATLNHPASKNINCKGGEMFLESATIISDKYAIYAKGGTVEVTDASVTVTGTGTMTEAGGKITHK